MRINLIFRTSDVGLSDFGRVTISLGVASSTPGKDQGPAELLRLADGSLYRAKSEGQNCIRGISPWII
ncbi:MAG: GGDEF domain-containing protein [Desulfomicrobium sp.]|nr:GGDEF domain-containing protein [Pseudomonadota bacterium]MBU4570500.1 GGDEF domain-containing protein [Pseudomonadota bacterium]MBV1713366.1 GGDEF domain-containing protein [Desulfomicrobium sp.]MBV1719689.1 GGDEF domain-containing protein [Desulfomicrobium sp.]MBV1749342.1 GGDEF domain-containing protein [Desulfomicrobium sp.]